MVVPKEVSPVDYLQNTNEYVFLINDFILKVNYQNKLFEVVTGNKQAFTESFTTVDNPPEWLDILDFGLVDYLKLVLKWKMDFEIKFKLEDQLYYLAYNTTNHELLFQMESRTISTARDSLTTIHPEFQYWEDGKLLTKITDFVLDELCDRLDHLCNNNQIEPKNFATQKGYNYSLLTINQNSYEIGYSKEFDKIILIVPKLSFYTNLLYLEKDLTWISEMNSGAMFDIIRDTIQAYID